LMLWASLSEIRPSLVEELKWVKRIREACERNGNVRS